MFGGDQIKLTNKKKAKVVWTARSLIPRIRPLIVHKVTMENIEGESLVSWFLEEKIVYFALV